MPLSACGRPHRPPGGVAASEKRLRTRRGDLEGCQAPALPPLPGSEGETRSDLTRPQVPGWSA